MKKTKLAFLIYSLLLISIVPVNGSAQVGNGISEKDRLKIEKLKSIKLIKVQFATCKSIKPENGMEEEIYFEKEISGEDFFEKKISFTKLFREDVFDSDHDRSEKIAHDYTDVLRLMANLDSIQISFRGYNGLRLDGAIGVVQNGESWLKLGICRLDTDNLKPVIKLAIEYFN